MTVNIEALRFKFEKWVMATEHKPYGWLGREWLDRLGDSYEDSYVHGLWTSYLAFASAPPEVVNVAFEWIAFDRNNLETLPTLGKQVLVRYKKPWPDDKASIVFGATLDKPWGDCDFLGWYNDRGEAMRGCVTHWMPMIEPTDG